MIFDEEPEVDPKDVVKEEEDKPCAKAYYHFNNKLATAPKAVPEGSVQDPGTATSQWQAK